jgi:hypothetical protein
MKKIFICGCGHSGTTLLQALFLAHSKCIGLRHESDIFLYGNEHLVPDIMQAIDEQYASTNYMYYIEKTPRHVRMIREIYKYVLDPTIIICYRNPLDVVASLRRRGYGLDDAIDRYVNDNESWLLLNNEYKFLKVQYETFVANPVNQLSLLCKDVGLEFEEKMMLYWQSTDLFFGINEQDYEKYITEHLATGYLAREEGAQHQLYRNFQIKQPITDMSQTWQSTLTADDTRKVIDKTNHIAEQLGYSVIR